MIDHRKHNNNWHDNLSCIIPQTLIHPIHKVIHHYRSITKHNLSTKQRTIMHGRSHLRNGQSSKWKVNNKKDDLPWCEVWNPSCCFSKVGTEVVRCNYVAVTWRHSRRHRNEYSSIIKPLWDSSCLIFCGNIWNVRSIGKGTAKDSKGCNRSWSKTTTEEVASRILANASCPNADAY